MFKGKFSLGSKSIGGGKNKSFFTMMSSLLLTASLAFSSHAITNPSSEDGTADKGSPSLELLKNFKGKNQIKLLNNRFRIDYEVDELVLLMFRKHGSPPVVLVRPDGSKIYVTAADDVENTEIEWHADVSYDLIRLKKPMPGPWQALGKIEDSSKILVLSDVQLEVGKLPKQVFQTEMIKSEAWILNAGEMINDPSLRDVVRLRAYLYSTNEPDEKNFGASIYRLGEFFDDGRGLDERPRDGRFTVELVFNSEEGNWTPKFNAKAELFTREVVLDPIRVLPSPMKYEAKIAAPEEKYHFVTLVVDDTYVDDDSLVFQGEIDYPNGDQETFHLNKGQSRELSVFQAEYGKYEIRTEVFGTDKQGREFVLKPPPFEFETLEPVIEVPEDAAPIEGEVDEATLLDGVEMQEMPPEEEGVSIGLIVGLNLIILIIGFVVIWKFVLGKAIPNPLKNIKFKKKAKDKVDEDENRPKDSDKPKPDNENSDDILDLSLPDD